jgi:hypothetical protein
MLRLPHPILLFPLAAATLIAAAAAPAKKAPVPVKLPYATGRITYRLTSAMGGGTSVVSWAEGGKKFREEDHITGGSGEQQVKLNAWTVGDGTSIFRHEPTMGKQVRRIDPAKVGGSLGMTAGIPLIAGKKDAGTVVGKGKVLGKPCEIRQVGNFKMWVWQNLPLKGELASERGTVFSMEATKLEPSAKLDKGRFKLPSGYEIVNPKNKKPAARTVAPVRSARP